MAIASRRRLLQPESEPISSSVAMSIGCAAMLVGLPTMGVWLCLGMGLWGPAGFLGAVVAFFIVSIRVTILQNRKTRTLARMRPQDSICTFARSFDFRRLDTLVIRAAYEAFRRIHDDVIRDFPVRADDQIAKIYLLDGDEIEEYASEIARRCGRSMANIEANPYCGRVATVGDLVHFLCGQPRLA